MANLYQVTAIDGQTVFDLPSSYTVGSNELFVFWNGQIQYVTVSYTETSTTRVTLLFSAQAGDVFTFRVPSGAFSGFVSPTQFGFAARLARPATAPTLTFTP